MKGVIPDILNALNDEVITELNLAKSISHPGESGRAREQVIEGFLRRLIPSDFSISTGFVIDTAGSISRQVDLVIYRNTYHPVMEIGGVKHFMIESVAAVIENKASIKTKKRLRDALDNIKSVKSLDKTAGGTNYLVVGGTKGDMVDPNNFKTQVFGAVVTEQSMSKPVFATTLLDFLQANGREVWPNLYIDVHEFAAQYLEAGGPGSKATVVPSAAKYLGVTDNGSPGFIPPLVELAFEIVNFLRISPTVDFKPTEYIYSKGGKITGIPLPDDG